MTQIKAHLMKKNIATNCSEVTVPVLAGWTKKPFGHYAILKLFFPQITKLEKGGRKEWFQDQEPINFGQGRFESVLLKLDNFYLLHSLIVGS